MTIDEAIYGAENPVTMSYSKAETALLVLAAEVRRLRAAAEAVRALPCYNWTHSPESDESWMDSRDVLRILEATDGD